MIATEGDYYYNQLITYIGNKRKLIPYIEYVLQDVQVMLNKEKLSCVDMFSGSGVVSRVLMKYSNTLTSVDLEEYARVIGDCYLYTYKGISPDYMYAIWEKFNEKLKNSEVVEDFFTKNYSESKGGIQPNDRLFYTYKNGTFLDTFKKLLIDEFKDSVNFNWFYSFFMAPLLSEASIHTNTCGVFKGFYKGKDGVGKFGGESGNCLERIKGDIKLEFPVVSDCWKDVLTFAAKIDCNDYAKMSKALKVDHDFVYIDPPYNQHPYSSNYFMLNLLADKDEKYKQLRGSDFSRVSGIPYNWNRSDYNVKTKAKNKLFSLLSDIDTKFVLLSYSSDGFIGYDEMHKFLTDNGDLVDVININYQPFRGSRNFDNEKKVIERMFLWKKK